MDYWSNDLRLKHKVEQVAEFLYQEIITWHGYVYFKKIDIEETVFSVIDKLVQLLL